MEPAAGSAASDASVEVSAAGLVVLDATGAADVALDFERAYVENYAVALRWATALMADPQAGADVVQEAFLRIFSKVRPLRRPESFTWYLRRTIVRTAASKWRSERRAEGRVARVQRLDGPAVELPADVDPELLEAVRRLPARQRSVIVMRYWLDWPEQDIAHALGCRPGTVKSLCSRALGTLRTELADD